uniref:SGL domain-containing protein n=1 Tax=Syphacia muris TaxID=451379 RepID=A0A0N5A8F3_9BILA
MPKLSNTSDHQRFDEMFIHLTPKGAVVPYNLCIDVDGNYWVASKGGLFKFGVLYYDKKVVFFDNMMLVCFFFTLIYSVSIKIIYASAEDQVGLTEFRVFDLSGNMLQECFIDGKVQGMAITSGGDLFLTKQVQGDESAIFSIICPSGWEPVFDDVDIAFQTICMYDSSTLITATCSLPMNMYSNIQVIDVKKQKTVTSFSKSGKEDGEVYFPRCIRRYNDNILVLDKTGRIQEFTLTGEFVRIAAQIDAYLGNGFTVDGEQAVIACSGIVMGRDNETICDDWIEKINLDGSKWIPKPVKAGESSP